MSKANDTAPMETNVARAGLPHDEFGHDPLALYESETPFGGAGDAPIPFVTPPQTPPASLQPSVKLQDRGPIPLDQIVNRLGLIAWPEAVAIVEGVCTVLTGDLVGGTAHIPELSHILITAQGTVVLVGRGAAGEPGPRLARTLHSLTISGTVPVPVRLFVTKWASITTEHSVSDFSKELAYFARPDGVELVKGVYERAASVPAVHPRSQPTVGTQEPPRPKQWKITWRGLQSRWVVAAVVVITAGLAALLVGRVLSTSLRQGASSAFAGLVSSTTAAPVQATTAGSANQASLASSPPQPVSAPQAIPPASTRAARGAAGLATRSVNPVARRGGGRNGAPAPTTPGLPSFPESATTLAAPAVASAIQADEAGRSDTSPIYSAEDRDVTPPEIRHPQLPPPLFAGIQEDTNTIELIISENGTVERVRLLSTPKRMADMMLLSGAKTWEFAPASRQGQTVRYRLLLTWAATP